MGIPVLPYNDPPHPRFAPPDQPFVLPPAAGIPPENRGQKAQDAAGFYQPPAGSPVTAIPEGERGAQSYQAPQECSRRIALPMGLAPVCWSDVVVYSAAVGMIVLGALSVFRR